MNNIKAARMKGGDGMGEMGMTDLQFKSWIRQMVRGLEAAKREPTKEKTGKRIAELMCALKEDLRG